MSAEWASDLRKKLSLYEDAYRPGPRLEAPVTKADQDWFLEKSNNATLLFTPGIANIPPILTKRLGGTPQQVLASFEVRGMLYTSFMGGVARENCKL